ncbi:hypothetical protein HK099_007204 [Clydaea vesicula]|uniref:Exocyst complex component SEC5 n=1 Tax=Clydaea vesicula TaxID=447962 RepID=A0AAD5Y0N5_9FUNG|nr:hypothetical protein HK099_007204 [Clydaea vesicula]
MQPTQLKKNNPNNARSSTVSNSKGNNESTVIRRKFADDQDSEEDSEEEEKPEVNVLVQKQPQAQKLSLNEQEQVVQYYKLESFTQDYWLEENATEESVSQRISKIKRNQLLSNTSKNMAIFGNTEDDDTLDPLGKNDDVYREKRKALMKGKSGDENILKPNLLITSKNFDPKFYLNEVHINATYNDLVQGSATLKTSIQHRNDVMKNLVKTHFAKFVSAKSTIDSFYHEMRNKNLISSTDFGIAPFVTTLNTLSEDANKLYGPMLERRAKAEEIRTTLSVLDQWKFFFSLPATIKELIRKHKYDAVIRDYNKGKSLMLSSFPTAIPVAGPPEVKPKATQPSIFQNTVAAKTTVAKSASKVTGEKDNLLSQHHQKVFEKVWEEVNRIISDFSIQLLFHLRNPRLPLESQERTMSYLVELDPLGDPVWFYLENQYSYIIDQIDSSYKIHQDRLDALMKLSNGVLLPAESIAALDDEMEMEEFLQQSNTFNNEKFFVKKSEPFDVIFLKKVMNTLNSRIEFENLFSNDMDTLLWKSNFNLIKKICSILKSCIPTFGKVCKIFIEHRLEKDKKHLDLKKQELCHQMLQNMLNFASALISNTFFLEKDLTGLKNDLECNGTSSSNANDGEVSDILSPQSKIQKNFNTNDTSFKNNNKIFNGNEILNLSRKPSYVVKNPLSNNSGGEKTDNLNNLKLPVEFSIYLFSHPLKSLFYTTKICDEVRKFLFFFNDNNFFGLNTLILELCNEIFGSVNENLKDRFINCICDSVLLESKNFFLYQDWKFEQDISAHSKFFIGQQMETSTTTIVKLFYRFLKYTVRSLHSIVSTNEVNNTNFMDSPVSQLIKNLPNEEGENQIKRNYIERIRQTFYESLYLFLDGLEWLGVHWNENLQMRNGFKPSCEEQYLESSRPSSTKYNDLIAESWWEGERYGEFGKYDSMLGIHTIIGSIIAGKHSAIGSSRRSSNIDIRRSDIRILVIISDLQFLKSNMIPKLCQLFENKFKVFCSNDTHGLVTSVEYLDEILFRNYCRRKSKPIIYLLKNGILKSGLDWYDLRKPQGVRSFCYEALLLLVMVHAQVSDVSKELVKRILNELLHNFAQELLINFRQVDKFSLGGMMQAHLEIMFLEETLKSYENPEIKGLFDIVKESIEENCEIMEEKKKNSSSQNLNKYNEMLNQVNKFLEESKRSTFVQFSCFSN